MKSVHTHITDCKLQMLPKINHRSGNLTALNNDTDMPFAVKRVYYTYDVPAGETRGGHAHKELYQYIIAASGSFEVLLDDGMCKKNIRLYRPDEALLIVPGIWRELLHFSSGSVCLVLASDLYLPEDYMYEYEKFKQFKLCK